MGYWYSIEVVFSWRERRDSDGHHVEYPPNMTKMIELMNDTELISSAPFRSEELAELNINEHEYGSSFIAITARDEGIGPKEVIEWWYDKIYCLGCTDAKLKIISDCCDDFKLKFHAPDW